MSEFVERPGGREINTGQPKPVESLRSPVKPLEVVSEQSRREIFQKYNKLVRPENLMSDTGAQLAHSLEIEDLLPQRMIPLLSEIHQTAIDDKNEGMLKSSSKAINVLNNALNVLGGEENLYQKFLRVKTKAVNYDGSSEIYRKFEAGMRDVNAYADDCLRKYADKVRPDKEILLPNGKKARFDETVKHVLRENEEALEGADLGKEFKEKFKEAKAVVFSVDLNSVVNADESFPSVELIGKAHTYMNKMINGIKEKFPDKEVMIVVNTGRPSDYAWGSLEQLFPNQEARKLILSESGGVVMKMKDRHPEKEVAVDNPAMWEKQLSGLKTFLGEKINGEMHVEPKSSMLSIKLAGGDGKYLMQGKDGKTVDGEWMNSKLGEYWKIEKEKAAGNDEELKTIGAIESKLKALYNPTAGFVDISDPDINKFSTLKNELKKEFGEDAKTCIIHFGDSSTDMPKKGAEDVFSYWVGNTKEKLIPEIEARGEYGKVFARDYALGYRDILASVDNAIKEVAERKAVDKV